MEKVYIVTGDDLSTKSEDVLDYISAQFLVVSDIKDAKYIFVFGGDGTMLRAIHEFRKFQLPFFGLNCGHLGFLMNEARRDVISEFCQGEVIELSNYMLRANLFNASGGSLGEDFAFNDFYFERTMPQTAKIRIRIDNELFLDPLVCDGVIVCSSAGSTAYNASAQGIILFAGTKNMVLTGICPALFHHWRSKKLEFGSAVILEPTEIEKRPVRFLADGKEIEGVGKVKIGYCDETVRLISVRSQDIREKSLNLAFNNF